MQKHRLNAEQKFKEKNVTREKTTLNRPARAISFGGSAGLNKTFKKAFNSTVEFVNENEAAYNAIYSLIVAGLLKPLFVLNMPGSEEKDKQIVATKNFLQATLGCVLSLTIGGGFIKKANDIVKNNKKLIKLGENDTIEVVDHTSAKALELAKDVLKKENSGFGYKFKTALSAIKDTPASDKISAFKKAFKESKYTPTIDDIVSKSKSMVENLEKNHLEAFKNNPEFLKELKSGLGNATSYDDAFEVFWKNSTGALTAILKAKISSLLLPGVMAFLFAKKNLEREMQERANKNATCNTTLKNQQDQFRKMMNNKESNQISFKGNIISSAIDGTASLIEKAGMSKHFGEPITKTISKFKKPSARMSDFESFAITAYWLQNTARSEKIEPSQKLGLNVHSALVTLVSSTAAFIIDWALDGLIDNSKKNYKNKLEQIAESVKDMANGENLDTTLKEVPDKIKMGIRDEVVKLLNSKQTSEGFAQITQDEIDAIVSKLKNTKTFEGFALDENLVKKAAQSLEKSEPIRHQIAKSCQDLIGAKDIAKNLSVAIGNDESVAKEIAKLTGKYGKKLSKFKSLTIFTLVVRFLVPVLMVPFSGKLKKKIIEWTGGKALQNNDSKKTAKK